MGSNSNKSVSDPSPNLSLQREREIDQDPDPKNFPPEVQIKGDVNSSSRLNQIPYVHASMQKKQNKQKLKHVKSFNQIEEAPQDKEFSELGLKEYSSGSQSKSSQEPNKLDQV